MNVLFLTQWYPNNHQPYFGIFVREQVRAVALAGHRVQVVALTLHSGTQLFKYNICKYQDESGFNVTCFELHTCLKNWVYHMPFLQELFLRNALRLSLNENGMPDLIHAHVVYPAGIWALHIAEKFRIPFFITEHWSRISSLSDGIYYNKAKKAYRNAKMILPVSSFMAQKIIKAFPIISEDDCSVIGNVIDSSVFYYKEKVPAETITFCAIATWNKKKVPDKMPELFIVALSEFQKKRNISICLKMIGGGNLVPTLAQQCKEAGIDAHFTGFLPKAKIAGQLQEADYFVHASTIETFSIVVAEALSCGLPVICSNTGALPELVDDSNGVLCENSEEDWLQAIERAITLKYNRKEIADNIENRFGLKAIGEKITEVYNS